ncbi:GNAT family N-acetyltransferase [Psychroflexus tropicus]|uniref:GNAT family N-acetyltransferase n=1 Tax=Psychroflexus tropicus TaxID=197345 RepID=UPI00037081C5|nr:GNAT family N-acetyltransferase [Psychroflexus tropicus]
MSILIKAFDTTEAEKLSKLSRQTFIESHGHSAKAKDIEDYIQSHFNTENLTDALEDPYTHFSKVYFKSQLAGYTKLILNQPHSLINNPNVAKFERLYLLKEFYGKGLGEALLQHNIDLAKKRQQKALWLFVWTQNDKGLKFYKKNRFKIVGKHNFKISDDHYNPNYVMLMKISK